MRKTPTSCCALCQISHVGNDTTVKELNKYIDTLRQEMLDNTEVGGNSGKGQTSVFIITSPGEKVLEANLINLGFDRVHTFERRVGYPKTGTLQMYIKNL